MSVYQLVQNAALKTNAITPVGSFIHKTLDPPAPPPPRNRQERRKAAAIARHAKKVKR